MGVFILFAVAALQEPTSTGVLVRCLLAGFVVQEDPPPAPPAVPERDSISLVSPLKPRDEPSIPYSFDIIDRADLDRRAVRDTPDAFKETRGVVVPRTTFADGSPRIRGFGAPRTLFLIDGVRLNTGVTRDDPDHQWALVDPFLVERYELARGPTTLAWGADGFGGTVNAQTRTPTEFPDSFDLRVRARYRYASAEDSSLARAEVTALSSSGALFVGATYGLFDDLAGGRTVGEMPETGFDTLHANAKLVANFGSGRTLTLGVQAARLYEVPRTHRTADAVSWHGTAVGTDVRHETDYERDLVYVQFRWREAGIVDDLLVSVSYQHQHETMNRVDAALTRIERDLDVRSGGLFVHAAKETPFGRLAFGGDLYADVVNSSGHNRTASGASTSFDRGEVADDAVFDIGGFYVQDEITLGKRFEAIVGARFVWARIHAVDTDATALGGPAEDRVRETYSGVVASARAIYHLTDELALIAGVAQGWRPPSLDETTSVREVMSGQFDMPNGGVDPERSINYELGARVAFEQLSAGVFGWYLQLDEFIARRPTGPGTFVRDNFDDGYVYGFDAFVEYRLSTTWVFWADVAWQIGNVDSVTSAGDEDPRPISRLAPAVAHVGVRFQPKGHTYFIEGVITGVRQQKRTSLADDLDAQRIPSGGSPGYTIVTLRGGLELLTNIHATVAVENVSHQDVRVHGSGINEPGTNFVAALDVKF